MAVVCRPCAPYLGNLQRLREADSRLVTSDRMSCRSEADPARRSVLVTGGLVRRPALLRPALRCARRQP